MGNSLDKGRKLSGGIYPFERTVPNLIVVQLDSHHARTVETVTRAVGYLLKVAKGRGANRTVTTSYNHMRMARIERNRGRV